MIFSALFVLVQDPECDGNIRSNEKFPRQDDDGFHLVILDQLSADLHRVAVTQRSVRQKKTGNAIQRLQVRKNMQNPGIIGIALRRGSVIRPAGIIFQIGVEPALKVEGRVAYYMDFFFAKFANFTSNFTWVNITHVTDAAKITRKNMLTMQTKTLSVHEFTPKFHVGNTF